MTYTTPRWANYLLCGFAFAWPLHVYKYIPYLDGTLTGMLMLLLIVNWVLRFRKNPIRIPFEYWWPLLAAFVISILTGGDETYLMVALTFVVTVQFARNRLWVENIMWATSLSIGLLAILNAFAHTLDLMPTTYALESGIIMHGPYTVSEGIYILILGILWGFYLAFFSSVSNAQRVIVFFLAFAKAAVLGGKLFMLQGHLYDWAASALDLSSFLSVITVFLLIWLSVRIVAKLIVTHEPGSKLALLLSVTIVGTILYWSAFPTDIRLYHAFLLGLAGGYALPDRMDNIIIIWPKTICVGLIGLVVLNIIVVFPMHEQDSRNLRISAIQDFEKGDYDRLQQRMSSLVTVYPKQLDSIFLWKARASIQQGHLEKASKEFAHAARFWIANNRADVVKDDVALIQPEMRDAVALLPEGTVSLAYERTLVALGESTSALLLLKSKLDMGDAMLPTEFSSEEKAFLYSALLGDLSLYDELKTWQILYDAHHDPLWKQVVGQPVPESVESGSLIYYIDRHPGEIRFYGCIGGQMKQSSFPIPFVWQKTVEPDAEDTAMLVTVERTLEGKKLFTLGTVSESISPPVQFSVYEGKIHDVEFGESRLNDVAYTPFVYYHPWAQILQILK